LTPHQQAAAAGQYPQSLAGFVRWLAPQFGELCQGLPGERAALRDRALTGNGSPRTPGIVADLALALNLFLDFAQGIGALSHAEREALGHRAWQALQEAAERQSEQVQAAEPTAHFLRLLAASLASGRAHVAGPAGEEPDCPERWGWRREEVGTEENATPRWRAQGKRIGWVGGSNLLLEPEASYAAAQELARDQGEALPVAPRTLHRRMKERGLLATWDARRQRNTVRRTLEGVKDREVLHLRADSLSPLAQPSEPSTEALDDDEPLEIADGLADGQGRMQGQPSADTVRKTEQNHDTAAVSGRFGRSNMGGEEALSDNPNDESIAAESNGVTPPPGARLYFKDEQGRACCRAEAEAWCWEGGPAWYNAADHPLPLRS
jgi:hypothetical protein